jgi:hypothetical protein
MKPHKLTLARVSLLTLNLFLLLIVGSLSAKISFSKTPAGGRLAVVVDERLAALRSTPELSGRLVRRLGRGRLVAIRGSRRTRDGVIFFLVNVTSRTHGWIQREAIVSAARLGDDRRLLELINASAGFDRIMRARIFLDQFPRSPLRPRVLLLLGIAAEEQAAKLSREAVRRLKELSPRVKEPSEGVVTQDATPEFTYFLNYSGLDRYNRQRVLFVFDRATKHFHYDGTAWRELVHRYPSSPEAVEARERLVQLAQFKN